MRIKELERIYGIHQGNGSNQHEQKPKNSVIAKFQSDLATQMGMSVDTLQNYKRLADMIPELEELILMILKLLRMKIFKVYKFVRLQGRIKKTISLNLTLQRKWQCWSATTKASR